MKKTLRLIKRFLLFGGIILAGILALNTVRFTSRQIPVEAVKPEPVDAGAATRLSKAVQYATISTDKMVDTAAFNGLDTFLKQAFPLVDSMLEFETVNRFSRIYRWQGSKPALPPVLLLAHLDVVPVEAAAQKDWAEAPFSGSVKDGYIWGRGALDDKINALGLLEAAEHLLQAGYQPERTLYFAFGHDEEVGGVHGAAAIAQHFNDQKLRFEYVMDEGQLVLEKALPGLDKPLAMIGISEKGFVTLDLEVSLAEGGHSSMPPRETAIGILAKGIDKLQQNPFPSSIEGPIRSMFDYAGPEMSTPFRVLLSNLWLTSGLLQWQLSQDATSNAMIRTTTAPTIIEGGVKDNVLPTRASAKVNFRILPGETVESVRKHVERTLQDKRVKVSVSNPEWAVDPSPVSDTRSFGFQTIHTTIREIFPTAIVAPSLVIGGTDSRRYYLVSDNVYRFMPIQLTRKDLPRFHGVDERISVENYERAVNFYRQLIRNSSR